MKAHHVALFVLVILLIGAVGTAAYFFGQNKALNSGNPENSTRAAVSPTVSGVLVTAPISITGTPTGASTATIVIDSEPNLPSQDIAEIKTRNINPFLDWQKDQNQSVVAVKVLQNGGNATYPYKFEYVLESGANGGYLITRKSGHLDWYVPECLNGCQFTDTFKNKYPEIVAGIN